MTYSSTLRGSAAILCQFPDQSEVLYLYACAIWCSLFDGVWLIRRTPIAAADVNEGLRCLLM